MTTDKELLELAAKAACIDADWSGAYFGDSGLVWNPLKDDGDALRLAVKLKFEICIESYSISVRTGCGHKTIESATMGYSIEDATRRAIVRSAAEIGKAMP